jgi:pimeloyl-ACP methyl ester carboxylesterase
MALDVLREAIPGYPAVPVAVLGHSLGGFAAQELVRLLPAPATHLVLVSTGRGQPDTAYDMDAMARALGKSFWQFSSDVEKNPVRFFEPVFGPGYAVRNRPAYEAFIAEMRANIPSKAATMAQLMAGSTFSSVGWAKQLQVPTLVIHGSADVIVSARSGRLLARDIPTARYLEFYNVGHFPMLEHPGFYPAVQRFLLGHGEGEELDHTRQGVWKKLYNRFFKLHG